MTADNTTQGQHHSNTHDNERGLQLQYCTKRLLQHLMHLLQKVCYPKHRIHTVQQDYLRCCRVQQHHPVRW